MLLPPPMSPADLQAGISIGLACAFGIFWVWLKYIKREQS
jgi:hypothetical protein